jgi:hypothetical protein
MPVPAPDARNQIVGAFTQQVQAAECLTWVDFVAEVGCCGLLQQNPPDIVQVVRNRIGSLAARLRATILQSP